MMLDEMERSVHDSLCVVSRVLESGRLVLAAVQSRQPSTSTSSPSPLLCHLANSWRWPNSRKPFSSSRRLSQPMQP
ncbi:hypothetical protein PMAYCL1PPCAC_25880, partial [Pristionchus mayeri]